MTRTLARHLARSPFLAHGRRLYDANARDWELPLTKFQKLLAGTYIILEDYSRGLFPPRFEDQAKAHAAEIAYRSALPGTSAEWVRIEEARKPFRFGQPTRHYLRQFSRLTRVLERLGVAPPARLLELGCGTGWMAEFLAIMGFEVTGTSIAPTDIEDANARVRSIAAKGVPARLHFETATMERVADTVGPRNHYDAVYVFEALHHAFDWRQAVQSSFQCLRPGGWLLLCNEPNLFHTLVSYRVARLSNTHEIGFSRGELIRFALGTGFVPVRYLGSRVHFWLKPHWIAAQKPA